MVLQQLVVSRLEVFAFAFVFPAEVVLHPDIGPAFAFFGFRDAALERVPRAVAVDVGRLGLAEQVAEIKKVLLAGRALAEPPSRNLQKFLSLLGTLGRATSGRNSEMAVFAASARTLQVVAPQRLSEFLGGKCTTSCIMY